MDRYSPAHLSQDQYMELGKHILQKQEDANFILTHGDLLVNACEKFRDLVWEESLKYPQQH